MLECGALVPCIASWPGKIPADRISKNLINLTDFFPTFSDIVGAQLPPSLVVDGKGFAPQLLGKDTGWPRDWIFVELGRHWYDRDLNWKLNEANELFNMSNAPYAEIKVPADTKDEVANNERKYLQGVLDQLNPAGGIVDPGDGSGRHANRDAKKQRKKEKAAKMKGKNKGDTNGAVMDNSSENANSPDE